MELQKLDPKEFCTAFPQKMTDYENNNVIPEKQLEVIRQLKKLTLSKRKVNHKHLTIYLDIESAFGMASLRYDLNEAEAIIKIIKQVFPEYLIEIRIVNRVGYHFEVHFPQI